MARTPKQMECSNQILQIATTAKELEEHEFLPDIKHPSDCWLCGRAINSPVHRRREQLT